MQAASATAAPAAPAGFAEVFQAYHGLVFRAAYRVTGNAGDAEDVLQTVFLRLLDRSSAAGPIGNMAQYLHRAAVNAAVDLLRARQRTQGLPLEAVESSLAQDPRLQPDRRQDARELRQFLRQAVARLSPKAAEMFVLRYFEGYDNPEIARMLGATLTNVAVTLHRSRSQLQEEIRSFIGEKP